MARWLGLPVAVLISLARNGLEALGGAPAVEVANPGHRPGLVHDVFQLPIGLPCCETGTVFRERLR